MIVTPLPPQSAHRALRLSASLGCRARLVAELQDAVQICLGCTRERALSDARAFIDQMSVRRASAREALEIGPAAGFTLQLF
jgi:hypothetical protein